MEHTLAAALARIDLFSGLDEETRGKLCECLTQVQIERGETLFREGDAGAALYVIERGEVRVSTQAGHEVRRLGRGQHLGEMSLIDPSPRSATVIAQCDTILWRLSADDFESFAAVHPQLDRRIAASLARRLRETTGSVPFRRGENVTLVVDARDSEAANDALLDNLQTSLETTSNRRAIVVRLDPFKPDEVASRIEDLLDSHDYVLAVLKTGLPDSALLRAAAGRANLVVILLTVTAASLASAREVRDGIARLARTESPVLEFALDRRSESHRVPFGPVDELTSSFSVHTIARTPGYPESGPPDFGGVGRLARRIARRRVGLVLGGGGARALAHIGVLAVLERNGIPVDVLAGTSAGALVAGLAARDWSSGHIAEYLLSRWNRRGVVDWEVIPRVSLLRGRKLDRMGRDAGDGLTLQELTRPFVAVATDLVTGQEVRLRRGDGWTAVFASLAVPGVFPPVRVDDRYLVDGGAIDNLPAAAAREAGADIVIGVNVSPPIERAFLRPEIDSKSQNGGWLLLRIIYRTISVQGRALQSRQGAPDLMLTPDVSGYDMFEFTELKPIIERGRIEAESKIAELRQVTLDI